MLAPHQEDTSKLTNLGRGIFLGLSDSSDRMTRPPRRQLQEFVPRSSGIKYREIADPIAIATYHGAHPPQYRGHMLLLRHISIHNSYRATFFAENKSSSPKFRLPKIVLDSPTLIQLSSSLSQPPSTDGGPLLSPNVQRPSATGTTPAIRGAAVRRSRWADPRSPIEPCVQSPSVGQRGPTALRHGPSLLTTPRSNDER